MRIYRLCSIGINRNIIKQPRCVVPISPFTQNKVHNFTTNMRFEADVVVTLYNISKCVYNYKTTPYTYYGRVKKRDTLGSPSVVKLTFFLRNHHYCTIPHHALTDLICQTCIADTLPNFCIPVPAKHKKGFETKMISK